MGEGTKIEWADFTFNPWEGCQAVSPGCDHCYAEARARRFDPGTDLWSGGRRRTSANNWRQPLKWNRQATEFRAKHGRPPMVFCASLADVFDNQVPQLWRKDLWALIDATPDLIWLLLTKRPQNIRKMLPANYLGLTDRGWPAWPNVWLGTTVENQAEADRRIPHLLAAPAAKRFLSCEPLLSKLDLTQYVNVAGGAFIDDPLAGALMADAVEDGTGWVRPCIDWVIAGGESGPHARPSHPDWFRSLRDQCAAAGVPFFMKQWGEWVPDFEQVDNLPADDAEQSRFKTCVWDTEAGRFDETNGMWCDNEQWFIADNYAEPEQPMTRYGKRCTGRLLDGIIHDARPEVSP